MQKNESGIRIENVSKEFSGKYALRDVNLTIEEGTIHSIVGENGAGKSTLMGILNGVLTPTTGQIFIDGKKLELGDPKKSAAMGVGMVFQHFMLVPMLTVWQNIILGAEPLKRFRRIDKKEAIKKIEAACNTYGLTLNLEEKVGDLTVGQQQKIEILKVLYKDAKYIILDEPTSVLTPQEIENLMTSMKSLKEMGKTVVFISHKLEEVMTVSDRISVLKSGELVGTVDAANTTSDELVRMMVGREVHMDGEPLPTEKGEVALTVDNISLPRLGFSCGLSHVSLEIRKGEILGIAGVDGNGQAELVEVLLGLRRAKSGRILMEGQDVTRLSNTKLREKGLACIPPDRHRQGMVLDTSLKYNLILGCENTKEVCSGPFISMNKLQTLTKKLCSEYDVRMASIEYPIRDLSGGNQQKVILARECSVRNTNFILAVNPTRGLDIGAIEFVYAQLEEYKKQGKAILLISTELSEVMRLSDRIAVMFKGQIMDTLERKQASVSEIGSLMAGIKPGTQVKEVAQP